jgi:predicted DNA-binding protein
MKITLELPPEVEARLWARARAQGVSLATYVQTLIEQSAALDSHADLSLQEFEAGMDALAEGSEQLPVLPPEAYSRESVYGDEA